MTARSPLSRSVVRDPGERLDLALQNGMWGGCRGSRGSEGLAAEHRSGGSPSAHAVHPAPGGRRRRAQVQALDRGRPRIERWDRPEQGGCSALVIGAGGAARGVIYGLLERAAKSIRIVNRTVAKAEALACAFEGNLAALPLDAGKIDADNIDLVVNTSSMGMHGQPPMSDEILGLIPLLPGHAVVCDIVYTPLKTPLLKAAKTHGLCTVDGLGMLLHQAAPGFEKWFGIKPEVTPQLRELVIADLPQEAK